MFLIIIVIFVVLDPTTIRADIARKEGCLDTFIVEKRSNRSYWRRYSYLHFYINDDTAYCLNRNIMDRQW